MVGGAIVAGLVVVAVTTAAIAMMRPDAAVPTVATPHVDSAPTIAAANASLVGVLPLRLDEVRCGATAGDFAFAFGNPSGRAYALVDGGPPAQQTDPAETTIGVGPGDRRGVRCVRFGSL